jgi:hypothetical protein
MQKEADHYTKKYEWERRNLLTLKGVEEKLQGEIEGLKKDVAKLKKESEEGEVKVMFTKMRNLQKQIDIVHISKCRTTNATTRLWEKLLNSRKPSIFFARKRLCIRIISKVSKVTSKRRMVRSTLSCKTSNQVRILAK